MTRAIDFERSWLGDWGGRLTTAHALVMIWFVMWLLFGTGSAEQKTLVTDIIQPLFSLAGAAFAFRASRQKSLDARTRRAWKILTVAIFVYFTANIIWFYYEIIVGGDLGVTWADPFYFACYPIVLAGLLTFPMARSGRSRLTFFLDAGTVMLGASMGIWHLILRPIALAAATSTLETVLSVAFPVMVSVTLFGIVTIMLRRPDRKVRMALAILMVAILSDAIAVFGYSYITLQSDYEGGNWPDCFYAFGFFLMVLSAQIQCRKARRAEPQEFALPDQRSPFPWLPYLAIGFAYGLLLFVAYKDVHSSSYEVVWLTIGAFMITGLVVARQIVALRENAKLLAERATRATEARFVSLVEESSDVITIIDREGKVLYESSSVERVFGYSVAEALGKKLGGFVHPDDKAETRKMMARLYLNPGMRGHMEFRLLHKDGRYIDVEAALTNLLDDPNVNGIVINSRDVGERKQTEQALRDSEDQLRQSQKMDAVGQLAGGVAHDFNNLLAVIIGYSDLLLMRAPSELNAGAQRKVEQISKAAHRAEALTRQLLAFSRKQVMQPKLLNLNSVVSDMDKMLKRLIGEHIEMLTIAEPELGTVKADPGQIEQVLLNLAVNARDAMSGGGKLTIETANVNLDGQFTQTHRAVEPGRYVMLAVSDTGRGMSPEVKSRIFEPFFTTKEKDKGTGLGLSTVYGIVKQSGGSIWVYSEPDHGATFKVYLPCVDEQAKVEDEAAVSDYRGVETILLVEDEESVREVANEILTLNGYKVLEASHGQEALEMSHLHQGTIDLLVTDVVMPLMGGPELAKRLALTRPQMRVLFMSGYTDDAIVHHGVLSEGTAYLQKPFTAAAFARKLRETISVSQN